MKLFKSLVMCISVLFAVSSANAALITLKSVTLDNTFNSSQSLLSYFNSKTGGSSSVINSYTLQSTPANSITNVQIQLSNLSSLDFSLFLGLDADFGAEIYVNDALLVNNDGNLWWKKDWNSLFVVTGNTILNSGLNTIDIFWGERCCNGQNSIAFSSQELGGGLLDLTSANLALLEAIEGTANAIDEPVFLFGFGLVLILISSRRKSRDIVC